MTTSAYIADADRHAILRADNDIANIGGVANETQTADIVDLAALLIEPSSRIGVIHG